LDPTICSSGKSPGEGDTFSLEGPEGLHFVARTVSKPETQSHLPHNEADM